MVALDLHCDDLFALYRSALPELDLVEQLAADEPFVYQLFGQDRRAMLQHAAFRPELMEALLKMQYESQCHTWRQTAPTARYVVVRNAGIAIGRVVIDQTPAGIHLVDISLLPLARGRGIGGALLDGLAAVAAARGLPIQAQVAADNPALNLYLRKGFVVEDRSQFYYKIALHHRA